MREALRVLLPQRTPAARIEHTLSQLLPAVHAGVALVVPQEAAARARVLLEDAREAGGRGSSRTSPRRRRRRCRPRSPRARHRDEPATRALRRRRRAAPPSAPPPPTAPAAADEAAEGASLAEALRRAADVASAGARGAMDDAAAALEAADAAAAARACACAPSAAEDDAPPPARRAAPRRRPPGGARRAHAAAGVLRAAGGRVARAGRTVVLRAVDGWVRAVVGEDAGGPAVRGAPVAEETHWLLGAATPPCAAWTPASAARCSTRCSARFSTRCSTRGWRRRRIVRAAHARRRPALRAAGSVSARDVRRGVAALLRRAEGGPPSGRRCGSSRRCPRGDARGRGDNARGRDRAGAGGGEARVVAALAGRVGF